MITFEIQPSQSRCNPYYLASILIVEEIIRKLKPKTDLYYSFTLTEPLKYPPILNPNNTGEVSSFQDTIIKDTNNALMSIYSNNITFPCDINEISEKVKESLISHLKGKIQVRFPLNLEGAINLLTPFSLSENLVEHAHLGLPYKLSVLIMAIYLSSVDEQVVQNVQILLEKEAFYLL